MKKTLVALAVLAASGASFAQVTVTGEFAFGYSSTTSKAGVSGDDASGMGTNTSEIYFGVAEDLGGGMKFNGVMQMGGLDRRGYGTPSGTDTSGAVLGKDFKMTLTTNVGAFVMSTAKSGDYLSGGIAGLGVAWDGMDGRVFSSRTSRDALSYIAPVGPITLTLSHQEAANVLGEGSGQVGNASQRLNVIGGKYAAGDLVVDAQWLDFGEKGTTDATSKNQARLSGSYDLKTVQFGLGTAITTQGGSGKITDSLVAVKAPLGNLTLGAQWANRNVADSTATANGSRSGYNLNAWYNLSKRTYLIAEYARWDAVVAAAATTSNTHLLLVHDF